MPMLFRNTAKYGHPEHTYTSLEDFYSQPPETGVITINYGGSPLDLLHINRGFSTTLIIFHAALAGPKVTSYPLFSGLRVARGIEANLICVSDPSLALGLELGWFGGNKNQPLQRDLPNVLRHLISRYAFGQDLVFFGASGGGFASLFYSHGFPGSTVITMNPQTNIRTYNPVFVNAYAQTAWGVDDLKDAPLVSDLGEVYREGFPNRVLFLQNVWDGHHRDRHLAKWLRAVPATSDKLFLLIDDWGRGHVPPSKTTIENTLIDAVMDTEEGFSDLGFVQGPGHRYPGQQFLAFKARLQETSG